MSAVAIWLVFTVGGSVVFSGAVFLSVWTIETLREWRKEPHQRSFLEGRQNERNRLLQDAWWFSESPATCELLRDLGNQVNVSDAREKWRKAIASEIQAEVETRR